MARRADSVAASQAVIGAGAGDGICRSQSNPTAPARHTALVPADVATGTGGAAERRRGRLGPTGGADGTRGPPGWGCRRAWIPCRLAARQSSSVEISWTIAAAH